MKRIRWTLNIGLANCEQSGEFDMSNDATDEEIEQAVNEQVYQYIDWGFEVETS